MKHRQRGWGPTQVESVIVVVVILIITIICIPFLIKANTKRAVADAVEASRPLRVHIGRAIADGQMPLSTQDMERRFGERLTDGV